MDDAMRRLVPPDAPTPPYRAVTTADRQRLFREAGDRELTISASTIRALVEGRRSEHPQALYSRLKERELLLRGSKYVIHIGDEPRYEQTTVDFLSAAEPTCSLRVSGDLVFFRDDHGRSPEWVLDLVGSLPIGTPEMVPFGFVEGGRIAAIFWSGEIERHPEVTWYRFSGSYCFVRAGGEMPEILKLGAADPNAYAAKFWASLESGSGEVVRLGQRLQERCPPSRANWDGRNSSLLVYGEGDDLAGRYVDWLPIEEFPGAMGRYWEGQPPFSRVLQADSFAA